MKVTPTLCDPAPKSPLKVNAWVFPSRCSAVTSWADPSVRPSTLTVNRALPW